jgi:beta-glucosidase
MMSDLQVSRRSALMAMGLASAWAASPLPAVARAAGAKTPAFINDLIRKMTLEEKAGQLTLLPSAWGGSKAAQFNPPGNGQSFDAQVADCVAGKLTGIFNGNDFCRRCNPRPSDNFSDSSG